MPTNSKGDVSRFFSQEQFFWELVKKAKWTKEQAIDLLLKKFKTSNWNALSSKEKRNAIAIMNTYIKKVRLAQTIIREKKLRQTINAIWIKAGHSRDELHSTMQAWGFGESLRALEYNDLCSVIKIVKKAVGDNR